jgi:endoglucanase
VKRRRADAGWRPRVEATLAGPIHGQRVRPAHRNDDYRDWSSRWLANILGANAWGVSLIVGDGTTFPHCIHHQVANLAGSLTGGSPVLKGAAVEGPNGTLYRGFQTGMNNCPADDSDPYAQSNGRAKFRDDTESFSTVEPAVDLTATSPLAFARLAAGLR